MVRSRPWGSRSAARLIGAIVSLLCTDANACVQAPDVLVERFLQRPDVVERLAGWGRTSEEVTYDLVRLREDEKHTLGCLLTQMGEAPRVERDALFVLVVAVMRERRLFNNVIQYSARGRPR